MSAKMLRIAQCHLQEDIEDVKVNLAECLIKFLERWDGMVCTGLIWLRIRTNRELL
jgi:hypothetical protein